MAFEKMKHILTKSQKMHSLSKIATFIRFVKKTVKMSFFNFEIHKFEYYIQKSDIQIFYVSTH